MLLNISKYKHIVIELILVVMVLFEGVVIYNLNNIVQTEVFSDMKSFLDGISCADAVGHLIDLENTEHYEILIKYGQILIDNGYEDKIVFQSLAKAYYKKENLQKSAEFLEGAIDKEYICDVFKPRSVKTSTFNRAVIHFQLSEVYRELGMLEEEVIQFDAAKSMVKELMGDNFSEEEMNIFFLRYSFSNLNKKQ